MTKLYIMRGISGSGKSTQIAKIKEENDFKVTLNCSADHFFMMDGYYVFEQSKLGDAHKRCFRTFMDAMYKTIHSSVKFDAIFIDNTNIQQWEASPYIAVGNAFDMDINIVTVKCDPETAHARNRHGVPMDVVKRQHKGIQHKFPKKWGRSITLGEDNSNATPKQTITTNPIIDTLFVHENIDSLCSDGNFSKIDFIISRVDFSRITESLIVALLVATMPAKEHLKNRSSFYDKSESFLLNEIGESDTAEVLDGLK